MLLKNNEGIIVRFSDCTTEVKANSLIKSSTITQMALLKASHLQLTTKITLSGPGADLGFLEGSFH